MVHRVGGGKYSEVRLFVSVGFYSPIELQNVKVFESIDTANNDRCVIKVLKPVAEIKIRREIKVLRNLTGGPNVVALMDVVRDRKAQLSLN